jgi:hypothetical protein
MNASGLERRDPGPYILMIWIPTPAPALEAPAGIDWGDRIGKGPMVNSLFFGAFAGLSMAAARPRCEPGR